MQFTNLLKNHLYVSCPLLFSPFKLFSFLDKMVYIWVVIYSLFSAIQWALLLTSDMCYHIKVNRNICDETEQNGIVTFWSRCGKILTWSLQKYSIILPKTRRWRFLLRCCLWWVRNFPLPYWIHCFSNWCFHNLFRRWNLRMCLWWCRTQCFSSWCFQSLCWWWNLWKRRWWNVRIYLWRWWRNLFKWWWPW